MDLGLDELVSLFICGNSVCYLVCACSYGVPLFLCPDSITSERSKFLHLELRLSTIAYDIVCRVWCGRNVRDVEMSAGAVETKANTCEGTPSGTVPVRLADSFGGHWREAKGLFV